MRVLPVVAMFLVACSGGASDDSDTGPDANLGETTRGQLFNATAGVPVFDISVPGGPTLAAGVDLGTGSDLLDVPLTGALSLSGEDLDLQTDPLNLEANTRISWFVAGDGQAHPWRFVSVQDQLPDPIPGIAHLRFIVAHPAIPSDADVLVDGSVLVSDLGYDQPWPMFFQPVSAGTGQHPVRLDAPGDTFDVELANQVFDDDEIITAVIFAPAGDLESVRMRLTRHPRE